MLTEDEKAYKVIMEHDAQGVTMEMIADAAGWTLAQANAYLCDRFRVGRRYWCVKAKRAKDKRIKVYYTFRRPE